MVTQGVRIGCRPFCDGKDAVVGVGMFWVSTWSPRLRHGVLVQATGQAREWAGPSQAAGLVACGLHGAIC